MRTAAILIVGSSWNSTAHSGGAVGASETQAGMPISCVEILGRSTLQRAMERFARAGVGVASILAEACISPAHLRAELWPVLTAKQRMDIECFEKPEDVWPRLERAAHSLAQSGFENIFVLRLGAYVEFDPIDVISAAEATDQSAVRMRDSLGLLDGWLIKTRRFYDGGKCLMPIETLLKETNTASHLVSGYVNRLAKVSDLRRLVTDMFHSRCEAQPQGVQQRPGIWIDEGAVVHRQARLVPPAYIGRQSIVGAAALITRSSNVERDCKVDYGTAIENSSVLTGTYIGAGLDVTHSVVWGTRLLHLQHNVDLEINDEILIGYNRQSALRRAFRLPNTKVSASGYQMQMNGPN